MAKKGLGRGLDALLGDNNVAGLSDSGEPGGLTTLRMVDIEPNRAQARKKFDETALSELAGSILSHGYLQPIVVRKKNNGFYEIIAGERRWRAGKMAGLSEIPVIIKELSDTEASIVSLIENLQREDLNPVEEAFGYKDLIEKYNLTQEEAALQVGKSRASVANSLRLLRLPEKVLAMVVSGELSYGHARTLLPLLEKGEAVLCSAADEVIKKGFSVRETEKYVKSLLSPPASKNASTVEDEYYSRVEKRASERMGRKVDINRLSNGKGRIAITYNSSDDLERLLEQLCGDIFGE